MTNHWRSRKSVLRFFYLNEHVLTVRFAELHRNSHIYAGDRTLFIFHLNFDLVVTVGKTSQNISVHCRNGYGGVNVQRTLVQREWTRAVEAILPDGQRAVSRIKGRNQRREDNA